MARLSRIHWRPHQRPHHDSYAVDFQSSGFRSATQSGLQFFVQSYPGHLPPKTTSRWIG
jgi:hypothetical protein